MSVETLVNLYVDDTYTIQETEVRNRILTQINRDCRIFSFIKTGRYTEAELEPGLGVGFVANTLNNLNVHLDILKYSNNRLRQHSQQLTANNRDQLYLADVRMYDTTYSDPIQKFIWLNNF